MHTPSPQTPRRVIPCGRLLGTPPRPVSTPTPSQTPLQAPALQVKTHVKAGLIAVNHNETLVRAAPPAPTLKIKTHVKAGALTLNHNQTLVRARAR